LRFHDDLGGDQSMIKLALVLSLARALLVPLALFNLVSRGEALTPSVGGSSGGASYTGPCDVIAGGCGEAYSVDRAATSAYSGALFQLSNGSSTLDIGQTTAHQVDLSTWAAFCGSSLNAPDANGVEASPTCFYSKISGQINGNALVPSVFNAGGNCTAGGNTCAAPFAFEIATGLPIIETYQPEKYTLAADGNATGLTVGTRPISVLYNGKALDSGYCCGPFGIGHAYNVSDTYGTTFYISAAQGQYGSYANNRCATGAAYCSGGDEESINDFADYAFSNIGSIFGMVNWGGSGSNVVKSYINGGLLLAASPPAVSLCAGCAGMNLTGAGSIHLGAGGDLSEPAPALVREMALTNTAVSAADYTAAYANIKAFYPALTFTRYTAPSTAVTVVQSHASLTARPATSATTTFRSATGTTKHGVVVGLAWCASGGCTTATSDVFSGGSVTVGSNACIEVPNSFFSGSGQGGVHYQTEVWNCPNLSAAASVVTATTAGTSVSAIGVLADEIDCPTSGCTTDATATGGGAAAYGWLCDATTHGNTANAGEFLYSVAVSGAHLYAHAQGASLNAPAAGLKDEWVATGAAGHPQTAQWLQSSLSTGLACSSAAIDP
jgi:hypothetical protein